MAQQEKKAYSNKLLQMKFMQRASEKKKLEEKIQQEAENEQEEAAAATPSTSSAPTGAPTVKGCTIIYESTPLPAGISGRMSFGGFGNKAKSKSGDGDAEGAADAAGPGRPSSGDGEISAADMAKAFRRGREADDDLQHKRPAKKRKQ